MLIQDALEVFICRRIAHRTSELNLIVPLFELQNIEVEETEAIIDAITTITNN